MINKISKTPKIFMIWEKNFFFTRKDFSSCLPCMHSLFWTGVSRWIVNSQWLIASYLSHICLKSVSTKVQNRISFKNQEVGLSFIYMSAFNRAHQACLRVWTNFGLEQSAHVYKIKTNFLVLNFLFNVSSTRILFTIQYSIIHVYYKRIVYRGMK